jgi:hypothetical protein
MSFPISHVTHVIVIRAKFEMRRVATTYGPRAVVAGVENKLIRSEYAAMHEFIYPSCGCLSSAIDLHVWTHPSWLSAPA